jgi:hypothetical protein
MSIAVPMSGDPDVDVRHPLSCGSQPWRQISTHHNDVNILSSVASDAVRAWEASGVTGRGRSSRNVGALSARLTA